MTAATSPAMRQLYSLLLGTCCDYLHFLALKIYHALLQFLHLTGIHSVSAHWKGKNPTMTPQPWKQNFLHCNVYYRVSFFALQVLSAAQFVRSCFVTGVWKHAMGSYPRKLSKPILLPINSDTLTVCADVPRVVFSSNTTREISHKVFSGIWWDTEGLQQWLVLKLLSQAELLSIILIKSGPVSPTEEFYRSCTPRAKFNRCWRNMMCIW